MAMDHYFTSENDRPEARKRQFRCVVAGKEYRFTTGAGVFSKQGLDFGSRLLLETILPTPRGRALDLGCGYGPIGIILADRWKNETVMADINKNALALARQNAETNKVRPQIIESDGFAGIDGEFALIVTNPPIRAGKKTYYSWFEQAKARLLPEGELIFVIRKDQGALSALAFCRGIFPEVATIGRKSGYFVISCRNTLTV